MTKPMIYSFLIQIFQKGKFYHRLFQIFWNNQNGFDFKIFHLYISGEIPAQNEGQWLQKRSKNLSTTTFMYINLTHGVMDPIPHPDPFYHVLLTTRYIL